MSSTPVPVPPRPQLRLRLVALAALALSGLLLTGCSAGARHVCIAADGETTCVDTRAGLAYEVLREVGIELGELDRVEPDYWAPVSPGLELRVVRVVHEQEVAEQPLPFERRLVKTLSLEPGVSKLLQAGSTGTEAVTYLVVLEDGVEVRREQVRVDVTVPPRDEVVAVGMTKPAGTGEFGGTVAYLAQGNAWVLRGDMEAERALTATGDLDGRVFELSPDGRSLVFTRRVVEPSLTLNRLYAVSTEMVDPAAEDLGAVGVLRARWSPTGNAIVYTTAEGTEGSPGWRARNDLWLLNWVDERVPRQVLEESCLGPYCWWGPELAWGPSEERLYLADASAVYEVDLVAGAGRMVVEFAPVRTGGNWAWVPELSVVPGTNVVAMAWPATGAAEADLTSRFDLVVIDPLGGSPTVLAEGVGMWSRPRYTSRPDGTTRVAYGVADTGLRSSDSPYAIWTADGDGTEAERAFPPAASGSVLYETVWSSPGYLLIGAEGGLYLVRADGGGVRPLLEGVPVERVQWAP